MILVRLTCALLTALADGVTPGESVVVAWLDLLIIFAYRLYVTGPGPGQVAGRDHIVQPVKILIFGIQQTAARWWWVVVHSTPY